MNKKFKLKVMALILAMTSLTNMTAFAGAFVGKYHTPGPIEYELDRNYLLTYSSAALSQNNLIFDAGGTMKFDLQLPFDSDKLILTYETVSEQTTLEITTDKNSYSCNLSPKSTSSTIAIRETCGSKTITFTSDKPLVVASIKFVKILELTRDGIDKQIESGSVKQIELDEYDDHLLASVVFSANSSVMKSRGAIRRLDVSNPYRTPKNIAGKLYVPLTILAQELKLYTEDYPDKSYLLIRDDMLELVLIGGQGYTIDETGAKADVNVNIVYEDGITWVPVRQLAELFGYYVNWKDGIAVIDDRIQTDKILKNQYVFAELKAELDEYNPKAFKGKTYHVAKTASASDANSGTAEYPFATIGKAAKLAQAGDTVIIHEGTYRETLTPENDGTKSAPIIFKAAQGEKVTISALEPVSEFVKYDDNIYCAVLPKDLGTGRNQLFYKGEALQEGRHPNVDTKPGVYPYPEDVPNKMFATKGNIYIPEPDGCTVAVSDTDLNYPVDYWKGGIFVTLKGYGWSLVSGDITGSKPGEISLKDHDGTMSYNLGITQGSWLSVLYTNGRKYYTNVHPEYDWGYITNHLNTVDLPGEWYIGKGKIFLYPPLNANLSTDFEVKQRQLTIDLRDRKYVTIQGINTIGGGMTMYGNTEGNVLNGGSHKYISHFTKCIDNQMGFINPGDTRFKPGAPHAGEVGFFLGGRNNAIMNTDIEWSACTGIYTTGKYHLISNNIVANTSYMGSYPGGITVTNDIWDPDALIGGHTVVHNEVYNAGRAVFGYYFNPQPGQSDANEVPSLPSEIAYNKFYNGSLMTRDTGVTYEYSTYHGTDRIRTSMHHNYVYNCGYWDPVTDAHLFLVYHDGYIQGRETYNNMTFYSNDIVPLESVFEHDPWTKIRKWNNSEIGYFEAGPDGLTEGDFYGGKPFYAGTIKSGNERYMVNYNNIISGDSHIIYPATSNKGLEKPVYNFEDVHLEGDCYNRVTFQYKRDVDAEPLFNAKTTVTSATETFEITSPIWCMDDEWYVNALSEGYVFLPPMPEGEYDITIELSDNASEIYSVTSTKTTDEFADIANPAVMFAGTWDDWRAGEFAGGKFGREGWYRLDNIKEGTWLLMHNTWSHTAIFRDREIYKPANALELCFGTSEAYSGQTLKIYMDSMDSEPILETVLNGEYWSNKKQTYELSRTIEPGEHTFYLDFKGGGPADVGAGCTNIFYLKWLEDVSQGGNQ